MSRHIVDLTLDSDSEAERGPKRRRLESANAPPVDDDSDVEIVDSAGSDVELLGAQPRPQAAAGNAEDVDLGDEDLVITSATGQVATRDLPHPRPDCAENRFTNETSTSNAKCCPQCYCYVCDVKASECRFWGTGARERDHANARPLGYWKRIREAVRGGNRTIAHAEYNGSGPLGNTPGRQAAQQARIPFPSANAGISRYFPVSGAAAGAAAGSGSGSGAAGQAERGAGPATAGSGQQPTTQRQEAQRPGVPAQAMPQGSARTPGAPDAAAAEPRAPTPATAAAAPGARTAAPAAPAAATGAPAATPAGPAAQPSAPAATPAAPATMAANPASAQGATPAAAAAAAVKAQPSTIKLPNGTCRMQRLPDPSTERHAFELGVLRLGVKAVQGLTVAELASRLEPYGFYYDVAKKTDDHGSRFTLETLLESQFGCLNGKYKSRAKFMKLLPLPPPPDEAAPVSTERVRKVLVVDCLGRHPATVMGVRVQEKAKRADLLAALAPMLRPAFSPAAELLHLITAQHLESTQYKVVEAETTLGDTWFLPYTCSLEAAAGFVIVFRTAQHHAPTWDARAEAAVASRQRPGTHMPTYTHVSSGSAAAASPLGGNPGANPAWVIAHVRQWKAATGADAAADGRWGPGTTRLAAPLLVPVRSDHLRGGRDAGNEFNTAFLRGLQAYRTAAPLTGARTQPDVVLRGNLCYMSERPADMSHSSVRWTVAGESIGGYYPPTSRLPQLTAIMAQDLPASAFKLQQMRTFVVDSTAAPEAMAETEAVIKEAQRRATSLTTRMKQPQDCITELNRTSRRAHPEDKASFLQCEKCSTALHSVLVPSSKPGASPREGELIITVYTWAQDGPGRVSIFQPWDEWPPMGRREHVSFPLRETVMLLTTGATDAEERSLVAGAGAGAGAGAAGPSTSAALPPRAVGVGTSAVVQQRVRAERRRATRMYAEVLPLRESRALSAKSINGLLEYMQSGERPAAEQPPGLTVNMRSYQLQSLGFMLDMERLLDGRPAGNGPAGPSTSAAMAAQPGDPDDLDASDIDGPGGYRRLFWLPVTNSQGQRYWYSPVFERLTREVPVQPVGGFLAEEMGLGKTVEVMALTLANQPPPSVVAGTKLPCGRIQSRATLVVCAVSLVGQWQAEAQNKTGGSCRIHPYHGQSRIRDPQRLATEFDVVVTTYQTLQSDHACSAKDQGQASTLDPCQAIKWHRIVFDEGHMLKSAAAKMSKAACELAADRKWVCTGTPINNAVDDLLGQLGALHMMPLAKKNAFDWYIKGPFVAGTSYYVSLMPLLYTIRRTMIRHTKAQNLGGQDVLQLPQKTEADVPVYLTAEEQAVYTRVHREAVRGWQKMKVHGSRFVNSHLFTATSMLMPMRRICSGGLLAMRDLAVPDPERLAGVAAGGPGPAAGPGPAGSPEVPVPDDISECPICVDTLEQPVLTPCNHWFCRECLTGWINASAHHNCPACRQPVSVHSLRRGIRPDAVPEAAAAEGGGDGEDAAGGTLCESKLKALLGELRRMREEDPTSKALVFTQFGKTLDYLRPRLQEEGFGHRTITGDMTQKKRKDAIESFQRDPNTSVFLLSVRSGAVGINLTAANYVFLLEPCMNPAMEEQAIGRSWRMGQQRPVIVKRLYVKGSVEERIMEVVKTRRAVSGSAGGAGSSDAGPSTGGRSGALRQDKTDLRINELDLLFRDPEFPPAPAAAGP